MTATEEEALDTSDWGAVSGRLLRFAAVASFTVALALPQIGHADESVPKRPNQAEAVEVIRNLRRIVTPDGVEREETVRIGGIDQFITIRGLDRHNPVLLILHGGPGDVETPMSWWNTRELEEYFTVVQWDQRGAGKTYLINDPKAIAPTMRPDRMISDTEELISWLRTDFGKPKIFLLGHSWGSYLGLEVAKRHPDWLYAYIGTGQAANVAEGERRGYAYALAEAKRTGNKQAVSDLESIAPYAAPGHPIALNSIVLERKWSDFFGGVMAYRTHQTDGSAAVLSPDYSDAEIAHVWDGNDYSEQFLLSGVLDLDLTSIRELKCPLILLEGRHDRTVSSEVANEWFKTVRAPSKRFVWFEHSAHEVMAEEPGKVLVSLISYARPIAAKAGDVAN